MEISKKLAYLADQYFQDQTEDSGVQLIELIDNIIEDKNLDLSEITDSVPDYIEDVEALIDLRNFCQQAASSREVYDAEGNEYSATLFAIPLLFHKPAKAKIKNIDKNNLLYGELVKTLRRTEVVPEDSNVFIHHYLYHPNELMEASYNDIYNILDSMLSFSINPTKITNVNPVPCGQSDFSSEDFSIRYLVGIKIMSEKDEVLHEKFMEDNYDSINTKFSDSFSSILHKLFKIDMTVLGVEDFYQGLESGLDTYTTAFRRFNIEYALESNKIHPHGVVATLDFDNFENSAIELVSKLSGEVVSRIDINPLYFQLPNELIELVGEDLIEVGIKVEDIVVKMHDITVPLSLVLEQNSAEDSVENQIVNKLH